MDDDRGVRILAPGPYCNRPRFPSLLAIHSPQNIVPVTGLTDVSGSGLLIDGGKPVGISLLRHVNNIRGCKAIKMGKMKHGLWECKSEIYELISGLD